MNDKIVIIRNDLKNKIISDYKISGIIVVILLSKEIFPHNADLVPCVEIPDINYGTNASLLRSDEHRTKVYT